jgi:WD40 repeat protein
VRDLAISPDDELLAVCSATKDQVIVKLFNVKDEKESVALEHTGADYLSVLFSPDGRFLFGTASHAEWRSDGVTFSGRITIWDVATGKDVTNKPD